MLKAISSRYTLGVPRSFRKSTVHIRSKLSLLQVPTFKDSKVPSSGPYEPLSTGLVSSSTSTTTLKAQPESLRGPGSLHPSTRAHGASTQSLSIAPNTPALTVAVETLAQDFDDQQGQESDAPTSSTEPNRPFETPSPTVSSFGHRFEDEQPVEISDHQPPSRAPSTARQTLRSSFTRLKNISKASIRAPSRALSHLTHSRKSSKVPSVSNEVALQDTDTYDPAPDPDPFRLSSAHSQDSELPEPVAPFTDSAPFTDEPESVEEHPDPEDTPRASPTSSRAPTVTTVRRSSLRGTASRFGNSLRQSSRVSFKALSRISSSGRSQSLASPKEPAFDSVSLPPASTRPPSAAEPVFPGSPEFPPPRPRSRASSRTVTQHQPSVAPLSYHSGSAPEIVDPHSLTASPSVYPSEFDSPAATTLPPPSRPQSWWRASHIFSQPTVPEATEADQSPPPAPRSPPKELEPEPAQEQPEPSRAPTAKSSARSLFRRASSSQVTAQPQSVHQQPSVAPSTHHQPSAAPSTYHQPSAVPSAYQPSAVPSVYQRSAAPSAYQPSVVPSAYQPSAVPSTRKSSAPPSTHRQPSALSTRRQHSAPSAAPSYHTEKSAPPATPHPPSSASVHTRAPSATARSAESILFPRASPFGEPQPLAQPSLPTTRAPSRVPSHNTLLSPSPLPTPTPSAYSTVHSTHTRRTSPSKTHSRAASRIASRRTSRAVTRLPSIISSRADSPALPDEAAAPEKVASSVAESSPVPPIAITLTVPPSPSGSLHSSPTSSHGTSRKSRSRPTTHVPSTRPSLRSLARIPLSSLGSKRESRTQLSKSSRHPSREASHTSIRTRESPPPSPPAPPPPPDARTPSRKSSFLSRLSPSRKASSSQIFQPSRKPSRYFAPHELTTLPEQLFTQVEIPPEILERMPFNEDFSSIDAGMEQDYEGVSWFQNRPPKPEPKAPETVSPPYVPMPGVVEQNEALIYALQAAPNVLYANYKQYGQLGVLGWCAEFSELIDHIKTLGFDGNMFVNTRTQALATCQELLRLRLDIKMQIIIMYLSSQVARLRRFLDGDNEYNDYPTPEFPLDMTRNYG